MSMYPQHPPRMGGGPPNNRFNELLEQIRSEYESQIRSGENYEHQNSRKKLLILDANLKLPEAALRALWEARLPILSNNHPLFPVEVVSSMESCPALARVVLPLHLNSSPLRAIRCLLMAKCLQVLLAYLCLPRLRALRSNLPFNKMLMARLLFLTAWDLSRLSRLLLLVLVVVEWVAPLRPPALQPPRLATPCHFLALRSRPRSLTRPPTMGAWAQDPLKAPQAWKLTLIAFPHSSRKRVLIGSIYDVQTGEKICVLQDETADVTGDLYIRSVCFSPDGRYLATGAEDKLIRVWDIQNRTIRNTFSGHEQDIYSLDFARDGRTIASGSGDRTVRLWDIESGSNTFILTIEDGVTTVAISPDTKYVAAGSLDKSVRVWDIHQGYLLERLEGPDGHKDSVYSVAFSPNGKDLVSGSLDKTIKMWELNTPRGASNPGPKGGRCIKTFEGHRDFVLSVAFTPDGQWVMSGSKDRGVQFWDPRTGSTQLMLQGHKNSVISVAPSPTGGYFATGSGDMRARIWSYRNI
ncbi:Transcriptional repressor rco-1 [Ceratocystis platani]|uniref:Transcriptional repressor rco-1 n=1 Tax=Ceratocystis fimbriata f. sp. platani TaxID=88771 RepID=A0A0F8CPH3_CERFI|nr:Transcriptional repressor rco-1 [Ceratocystis platani]